MNRRALISIVLAQVASDGGKHIDKLVEFIHPNGELDKLTNYRRNPALWNFMQKSDKVYKAGYENKDKLIHRACLSVASGDKDIHFFVTEDKEGVAKFIIYFDVKLNGKRHQVSFHSFDKRWRKWCATSVPSLGHWDRKDSRETCKEICKALWL